MTEVQREARTPETIAEDIYNLLADSTDHTASEENLQWAGEVFKSLLRTRLTKRAEKRGEDVLRMSSLGKKDRQIWYAANKPETAEVLPGKHAFKFMYGDVIELLMLFLAREAGHTVEDAQIELDVDGVKGHIDAVIDGVLVDAKSASTFSFDKFRTGGYLFDDPFGYVAQLSSYAQAMGTERAGFLVADKVHGDILYVPLDKEYIRCNPPGPRIETLRRVIADPTPPARCYSAIPEGKSGNTKLDIGCAYCAYKDDCWSDANGGKGLRKFYYSRGVTWLTHVAKEPRVEEYF